MLKPPLAILFDWDGTLVDSSKALSAAFAETIKVFPPRPLFEQEPWRVHTSLRDTFPRLFGTQAQAARRFYLSQVATAHTRPTPLFDGVEEMLASLAARDIYLAVVSNKQGSLLRAEAEKANVSRFFSRIVGAEDAASDKPSPAPVHMALEPSGLPPSPAVWFLGDTEVDMRCAVAAGCCPILVHPSGPRPQLPGEWAPVLFLPHPRDIFTHLERLLADGTP